MSIKGKRMATELRQSVREYCNNAQWTVGGRIRRRVVFGVW